MRVGIIKFLPPTATPFFMEILNHYYSSTDVIRLISKYRISIAQKRHDIHVLNDIRSKDKYVDPIQKTLKNIDERILSIVPGRRKWVIFKNRALYKNSTIMNTASLERTIHLYKKQLKKSNSSSIESWYINLSNYIDDIRKTILGINDYRIDKPRILPEKKKKDDKADNAYRPIAHYKLLKDKIIIGQAAKYLTDILDSELCDSAVFAFRSKFQKKEVITHHDAIRKITEYMQKHKGKKLWVAECDIKKFYDCVNHKVAKQSLLDIVERVEQKGKSIDARAIKVFDLYLDSYSFYHDVLPLNDQEEMKKIGGKYQWEEDELKSQFYSSGISEKIGVPQGGAISCLIANLILDKVDRAVLQVGKQIDDDILYLRYCDDMIIIHHDKKKCEEALGRYQVALRECKLLCHKPKQVSNYDSSYWEYKSKSTYLWERKELGKGNVPWLSFVGYQIRYDGEIRIRRKSLTKELKKQELTTQKVLKAIDFKEKKDIELKVRRSAKQIIYRIEQKLISMSVGRISLHNYKKNKIPQLSWTVGFKKLNKNPTIEKQLKILDRSRERQISRLKKRLKIIKGESKGGDKGLPDIYFGGPFSYFHFILKK